MKKLRLLATVVMACLLVGCRKVPIPLLVPGEPSQAPAATASTATIEPEATADTAVQPAECLPAVVFEPMGDGHFPHPDSGDMLEYSYSICRLNDTFAGVDELNQAIDSGVAALIGQQLDAIAAKTAPVYSSVRCDVHEWGGYYSLVFTLESWADGGSTEYMVYYYDAWKGAQVDITEFLIPQGIGYFEDYLPAAAEAGRQYLLDFHENIPEEHRAALEEALELATLYVGQYPTPAFIGADGTIWAIVPVPSLAGPPFMYHQLPLELH